MKAQASFITILGILLLIIIVFYYASQGLYVSPVPAGVGEEQKIIQGMIEDVITMGTERALRTMEVHGCHMNPPAESVILTYIWVPYWQVCQNDLSPSYDVVKRRFEDGIRYYIDTHTWNIREFFGKNLSISNVSRITVNIVDNKIDVSVYMPTDFQGYPIRQPYTVSVPTKFKQLFDFAKDTTREINKDPQQGGRFFETFTVASIYNSEHLPTFGILTECGDSIHLTAKDISDNLLTLAVYTVANIRWWEEMSQFGSYAINSVNGGQYKNLEPRILFPDGFEVSSSTNVHIRNNEWLSYFPFPIKDCLTAYNIQYSFDYPVVINLRDPETGYDFNFAVYVSVEDMEAGDCDSSSITPGPITDPCGDLQCNANIRVEDCNGHALEGVEAYFGGCYMGTSDSGGLISGSILCGGHELDLYYSSDYEYYSGTVSSPSGTYTLCRINNLTIHFSELNITGYNASDVLCYPCAEPTDCVGSVSSYSCEPVTNKNCTFITFKSTKTGEEYAPISNIDVGGVPDACGDPAYASANLAACLACTLSETTVDYIPAGNYDVSVELRDPTAPAKYTGYFKKNIDLLEDTEDLYVNVPNFGKPADSTSQESCALNALSACGIEPLRQA